MSFRFLHLADLHIETAFGGRIETRERLLAATREALQAGVDLALDRDLHAVLIAGDAFDDGKLTQAGVDFLMDQMQRLTRAGIHVFYTTGNHDPGSKQGQAAQLGFEDADSTAGPEGGLHLFRRSTPKAVTLLDDEGEPIAMVVGAGHSQAKVETNLAAKFKRPKGDVPVVGILHTQVESAAISEEHANYAPSERKDYENANLDYWALGHVHKRQQVFADMPVWYAGNLQGRNPKEVGPKGGLLVELRQGEEAKVEFVRLAPVEWHHIAMADLQGASDRDTLLAAFEVAGQELQQTSPLSAQDLCVRFIPSGACPLSALLRDSQSRMQLEEELQVETGFLEVQIRPKQLFTRRDLSDLERTPSVQLEALKLIRTAQQDDEVLLSIAPALLPGNLGQEDSRENRIQYLRARLEGLEEELLQRCFSGEAWQ
ncbi:MAG: exonuclease SbcCD subunit D [Planctomycetota bacterium]|nr:exonuclease SbcCD subunit D [Planctomycetota bacterium]